MHHPDPPKARRVGFGRQAVFDLTTLNRPSPPAPVVYYLVPEPSPTGSPSSWRTVVGFGLVVGGGLGLGLVLALVLL